MTLPGDLYPDFDPNGVGLLNGHFIGLPFKEDDAQIVLISVPWDATVSFGDGTSSGATNILQESPQLDLYDPLVKAAWKTGIYLKPINEDLAAKNLETRALAQPYIEFLESGGQVQDNAEMVEMLHKVNSACEAMNQWVYDQTSAQLDQNKMVGLVGGDHSTPLGFLRALADRHDSFGILQIDAHLDLRSAYEGFTYSHASIFHNALKISNIKKLVQVGIRDVCEEEMEFAEAQGSRIQIFTDLDIRKSTFEKMGSFQFVVQQIITALPQKVYISFDIDGLDPSLCPNTGTPVPGGFSFQEAIYLLEELAKSGKEIIGFDLSEVAGIGHAFDGNVGARMLYKLANVMAYSQGKAI